MDNVLKARDIVNKTIEDIWYLSDIDSLTVQFDDGVENATGRSIIYSWFFWEFHREIPNIKILKEHHVGLKQMTSDTHPVFLRRVMWSVYEMCKDRIEVQTLRELSYKITNELFNKLTIQLEEYVTSSCILDYMEIMNDEHIKEVISNTKSNGDALVKSKNEIKDYLKTPGIYKSNSLKAICEADLVNWGQLLQAVVYRGFTTDMDNYFFPKPIMKGYAHGITKFHDSLIESCSSTKSLMAQDDPLRKTEFFNKKMQLVSQVIRNLVKGDCGSTEYNTLRITDNTEDYRSNFRSFLGKKYLKEDGTLGTITEDDVHLIGKRVKIRSATGCGYRHTYSVCETCYGDLYLNVPPHCNLGYYSAIALCANISQMVMSTKHYDGAATIDTIYIEPITEQIFDIKKKEQCLILKEIFTKPNRRVTLAISPIYNGDKSQLNYLEDLELIDEVTNQTVMRKSNIKSYTITVEDEDTGVPIIPPTTLTIGNGNDGAYLSKEMLYFIKENGWVVTEKGHYEFDLKNFPKGQPVFTLPKKHMNMLEFQQIVSKFMESSGTSKHRTGERLREFNESDKKIEKALTQFLELVNEKVTLNITHLEIFILVCMARDPAKNDARIPKLSEPFSFIGISKVFNMRSMGPVIPYMDQYPWLTRIESYDGTRKVGSPYDGILVPEIFNAS